MAGLLYHQVRGVDDPVEDQAYSEQDDERHADQRSGVTARLLGRVGVVRCHGRAPCAGGRGSPDQLPGEQVVPRVACGPCVPQ